MVDFGTLGGSASSATAVNDKGEVVGASYPAGNAELHAFSWTEQGGMVDLGTLGPTTEVEAVNDSGQVVGSSGTSPGLHAFSWTEGTGMVDLGTLVGSFSDAVAVNEKGPVAGTSNLAGDNASHAFVWRTGRGMLDIGTLGGSTSSASGVNDNGEVVGSSDVSFATVHAFSWTRRGGMVDLGTLGGSTKQRLRRERPGPDRWQQLDRRRWGRARDALAAVNAAGLSI